MVEQTGLSSWRTYDSSRYLDSSFRCDGDFSRDQLGDFAEAESDCLIFSLNIQMILLGEAGIKIQERK